ncbi:MocR-like pyridoxine biosynthesis transcription factor PdxR [Saccharopolyspora sp. 5N708]|uniref:MocR-like pyridoxine biosynthesis transcription factor PdxR n=1 Tax=Saccharopolyspora sp. 5N708 TaxID=3457424 RepID=UPI003FD54A0A
MAGRGGRGRTASSTTSAREHLGKALGTDLHLDLERDGLGVRASLIEALRETVRTGRLPPGASLPSSRTLAADLGLARNTVVSAYTELVAEGLLTARQGAGTRVARRPAAPATHARPRSAGPLHDLRPGLPDVSSFPRAEWLRATRRALASAPDQAFGYSNPRGSIELRTALANYLARTRGVRTDPSRIVICSGAMHGLTLLGAALQARQVRSAAVESYALDIHRNILAKAGLRTPAVELDGYGAKTDTLRQLPETGAVLLTTAHQFPTGVALHPDRRAAVIDWARTVDGTVIEDDYDGEFRYDRPPVGALQSLDPERVIYLGTTSKALAPGLRLGWMVLPEHLVGEVERTKGEADFISSALNQLVLTEFLNSGAYDRHVRARRLAYRRRRDQLVDALATHAPHIRVTGIAAGLHAVLELPTDTEQAVLRSAAWHRLAIQGISRFRHPSVAKGRDALVIGYATPSNSAWTGALDALCGVLRSL